MPSSSHPWKYDVFVSFRGRDVRRKFISHLFHRLKRDGFHYFSDNDKDNIGEKIRVKLFRAICYARFAIVLFSVNYADSKWCLNELVQILKCRRKLKKLGHVVIPVFFHGVDATELSKLTSRRKFGRGFKRLCRKARDKEQIRKWERALAKAKHISGFDLQNDANGNEAQLIDIIIESLHKKFRQHATETEPTQGCEEGYKRGIHYAGGHPLASRRCGSCRSDKSEDRQPKILESVGSYRGQGGSAYDDGAYAGGRQITVVRVNPSINHLTVDYDRDGFLVCSFEYDRHPDSKNFPVELDYPNEHLTSISGQNRDCRTQSLRSHTLRKTYGAFGFEEGQSFHFPQVNGGRITGHRGICGGHLDPMGAHFGGDYGTAITNYEIHTSRVMVFGPFGNAGETSWDFVDVEGIAIRYADFIKSITFEVNEATSFQPQNIYDANGGVNTFKVKLKHGEHISSFSGYVKADCHTRINSLTFRTNKRILGPIGREGGKLFSSPSEVGKVIGFFGTSGDFLESFGARVELYSNKLYPFSSVGLFGRPSGSKWNDGNQHSTVTSIIVELDSGEKQFIRSIAFEYEEKNKELWQSKRHGGIDGNIVGRAEVLMIQIDYPNEYLTSISGYTPASSKEHIRGIRSITFQTNKRTIGPIGDEEGRYFSSPATGGKIVGFYGWSGEHLEAIGAYFEPISNLYAIKSIGPFGGQGGCAWDDGKFSGVREIVVMHDDVIRYIMFVYDNSGERFCSVMHGGHTGQDRAKVNEVTLYFPREYLTSISGYIREDGAIQSLTFFSNGRRFGPFGKETGSYFWYPSTGSKIIGFYGTCNDETLNSIGVYAQPILRPYPFKTVGPFGNSVGTPWDDGVHTDVRAFHIIASDVIHSISIVYDNNGSYVDRPRHGGGDESRGILVKLDYPKERLISISGFVKGNENIPDTTICDLSIHTTKTNYGPFAWSRWSRIDPNMSTEFRIPSEPGGGRIVGFFGRAGSRLNSIGAHLETY